MSDIRQRKKKGDVSKQKTNSLVTEVDTTVETQDEQIRHVETDLPTTGKGDGYGYAPSDEEDDSGSGPVSSDVDVGAERQPAAEVEDRTTLQGVDHLPADYDGDDDTLLLVSGVLGFFAFFSCGGVLPLYGVPEASVPLFARVPVKDILYVMNLYLLF